MSKQKKKSTVTSQSNIPSSSSHDSRTSELSTDHSFSRVRRKPVFAEAYNPERDDDEEILKVYPKTDKQRRQLTDNVRNILLFRVLDNEQLQKILNAMFERKVKKGEYVIKEGDDGDYFYVVEKGVYTVYVTCEDGTEKSIHVYDNSGSFGEVALLYNIPRTATVQASTDGTLWVLDRQTFRHILLKSAYEKRKMYESLIESVPMLKPLQPYERLNLADALVSRTYSDGQLIFKQDDKADGMYFVVEGFVKIIRGKKPEVELSRVPKGGYFGELALVTHKHRAASAYAVGNVKLAFLDVEAFERLLGPCMNIIRRNINDFDEQLVRIFGSKGDITDIR